MRGEEQTSVVQKRRYRTSFQNHFSKKATGVKTLQVLKSKPPPYNSVRTVLQKWRRNKDFLRQKLRNLTRVQLIFKEHEKKFTGRCVRKSIRKETNEGKIPFLLLTNLTDLTFAFSNKLSGKWNEWPCYMGQGKIRNTLTWGKLGKTKLRNYNWYAAKRENVQLKSKKAEKWQKPKKQGQQERVKSTVDTNQHYQ